jgi:hypothetical protein
LQASCKHVPSMFLACSKPPRFLFRPAPRPSPGAVQPASGVPQGLRIDYRQRQRSRGYTELTEFSNASAATMQFKGTAPAPGAVAGALASHPCASKIRPTSQWLRRRRRHPGMAPSATLATAVPPISNCIAGVRPEKEQFHLMLGLSLRPDPSHGLGAERCRLAAGRRWVGS